MKNLQVIAGQTIKTKDFGHLESDYIIGTVDRVSCTGEIFGTVIKRVMDNEDVTGKYDDGSFSTVQNGSSFMDDAMGDRISIED